MPKSNQVFVEFVDDNDKPLMILPQKQTIQQKLSHRKIYLILQDELEHILVVKSNKTQTLNIPNTRVYAGEARDYASIRLLKQFVTRKEHLTFTLQAHVLQAYKYHTYFLANIKNADKKNFHEKTLWLDFIELQGFVTHFTDMLSDELKELTTHGHLEQLYALNNTAT